MLSLIYFELFKTFSKWRTYIGFITVGIIIPLILYVVHLSGSNFADEGPIRSMKKEFFIVGNLANGWFFAQLIMLSLWVHIPFLITLVAGDQLAGEATSGTFRFSLIRPISRSKFLFSKYITTLIYTALLVFAIALLSLGLGLYILGSGDLIAFDEGSITILSEELLFNRFILAYLLATISMSVVATLAFLFSSFVENAIGPIIATMAILVCLLVISNLPVEYFNNYKPYLFTTYQNAWSFAFNDVLDWDKITKAISVQVSTIILFYILSLTIFLKKDILS
ncbi:MAG: ABC transporter permease subunit [Bacteroidetes bacterium]|nr:ABC transporter permease subunit [Bacteroidota bacterium]